MKKYRDSFEKTKYEIYYKPEGVWYDKTFHITSFDSDMVLFRDLANIVLSHFRDDV